MPYLYHDMVRAMETGEKPIDVSCYEKKLDTTEQKRLKDLLLKRKEERKRINN